MKAINKVLINSLSLYINMAVNILVTLLGTRIILDEMGETKYGVYTLIASMVAMLAFVNAAMTAASQRFLSFSLGTGNLKNLKENFYSSMVIHIFIAVFLFALLSVGGVYLIENVLSINAELISSTYVVLGCMIVGICFTVLAVPYEAAMNAHEDINWIVVFNIIESVLKLGAAFVIMFTTSLQLEVYAALILLSQFVAYTCKRTFARRHYAETHYHIHAIEDKGLLKQMLQFAGWNLIGTACSIARQQGTAILLNPFFGLAINAAYGLAQQVNSFLLFFASSVVRPMRPIIIKKEGSGEHEQMKFMAFTTSRITFLMLLLVVVPLYVNMPFILSLWLKEIPEGTLYFCQAFLLIILINQTTVGLGIALESVGKIRTLQTYVGAMHILPIPIAYALFTQGFPPETIMYCIIVEEVICVVMRVFICVKDAQIAASKSFKQIILPCIGIGIATFVVTNISSYLSSNEWIKLLTTSCVTLASILILGYSFFLNTWEKAQITGIIGNIKRKQQSKSPLK